MSKQSDPRIAELQDLAREEQITLPMPVDLIVYFERHGRIVDLMTGVVYADITVATMPSAKAVCHLLAESVGEIQL